MRMKATNLCVAFVGPRMRGHGVGWHGADTLLRGMRLQDSDRGVYAIMSPRILPSREGKGGFALSTNRRGDLTLLGTPRLHQPVSCP